MLFEGQPGPRKIKSHHTSLGHCLREGRATRGSCETNNVFQAHRLSKTVPSFKSKFIKLMPLSRTVPWPHALQQYWSERATALLMTDSTNHIHCLHLALPGCGVQCLRPTESAPAAAGVSTMHWWQLAWPWTVLLAGKTQETTWRFLQDRSGTTSEWVRAWALESDRPGLCDLGQDTNLSKLRLLYL